MTVVQQAYGVFVKDLRQWLRDPQAMFGPMLLPLVLMAICTVLFGYGGDEWNIGLIVEGNGAESRAFAGTIEGLHGSISPYFRIITRDPKEAQQLAEAGRLQLVVTVPAEFDRQVLAGETPVLRTQVFNINTDMTKNVRLRLEAAVQEYLVGREEAPLTIVQFTTHAQDVWRRAFIAGGALVVALFVGAALNTAIMVAREWERQTAKEVRLAPGAFVPLAAGKLVAGLAATAVNVLVTLVLAIILFGLRVPQERWLPLASMAAIVALAVAGFGLGIGALIRDYRVIQPLLIVTFAGSFFAAGGYASVPTLPPFVQAFDRFWPPAYAFELLQGIMHGAAAPSLFWPLLLATLAALLGLVFGLASLRRVL